MLNLSEGDTPNRYEFSTPRTTASFDIPIAGDERLEISIAQGGFNGWSDVRRERTSRFALVIQPSFTRSELYTLAEAAAGLKPEFADRVLHSLNDFPFVEADEHGIAWVLPASLMNDDAPIFEILRDGTLKYHPEIFPGGSENRQWIGMNGRFEAWQKHDINGDTLYLRMGRIDPQELGNDAATQKYSLVAALHFSPDSPTYLRHVIAGANHAGGFVAPNEGRVRGIVNTFGHIEPKSSRL